MGVKASDRKKIDEIAKRYALGLDDEFAFACTQCGHCCSNVDVPLSPRDIIRAAAFLHMEPKAFVQQYCTFHIGKNSKMLVFSLKMHPKYKLCALFNGTCGIHPAKPTACALYPLARRLDKNGEFAYFSAGAITCGDKAQKQTVREWLQATGLTAGEPYSKHWLRVVEELTPLLAPFHRVSQEEKDFIYLQAAEFIYYDYDMDDDPVGQIEYNLSQFKLLLSEIIEDFGIV